VQVHYGLDNFNAENTVVTIGTFDGVHRGHQSVILRLEEFAQKISGESVIFTFYPHPRLVVSPDENTLRLLTSKDEKIVQLGRLGVDHLVIFPFTKEFSKLSYNEFVRTVLVEKMNIKYLVVGYDHKFGKNREGDFHSLQELSDELGFSIEKLDALLVEDTNVSSTKIRHSLEKGDVKMANYYLGYPYTLTGKVVEGNQLGRKLDFPTANIETLDEHKLIPGDGVYAVYVKVDDKIHSGMLNIGTRPTVVRNADHHTIEVHIFDFDTDIYDKSITIYFEGRIREEKKFGGVDELREQLCRDKISAQEILGY
jgi:riboflavin kinase/FMN adenylyltransferase